VFGHLLTQIKVSAYAADDSANTHCGQITGIKMKGEANKECRIVLPGTAAGAVTYPLQSGKTAGDLSLIFKKASDDTSISTPLTLYYDGEAGVTDYKQECGYAMFAPIAAVDGEATVTMLVSTTGGPDGHAVTDCPVTVTVTSADGFKAGTAYGITLKFSAQKIEISGTITEWEDYDWASDGGSFNGEITL
ncbi:MAG: fimbrillin family protein, partial [Alistipes sp.]|nr:fimbrillin family protein [Alistipes sp.]